MIAPIGATSSTEKSGSGLTDYVAQIAEMRRQLAAIQRRRAAAGKRAAADDASVLIELGLSPPAVALRAQLALLQLPTGDVNAASQAPPSAATSSPLSSATADLRTAVMHHDSTSITYDELVGGNIDSRA
ncbi:MAG: hypothetical protein ABI910_20960 [Gemmatimonadota bacterium]